MASELADLPSQGFESSFHTLWAKQQADQDRRRDLRDRDRDSRSRRRRRSESPTSPTPRTAALMRPRTIHRPAVVDAVAETGATAPKDMGRVMKAAMARLAGQTVDGKAVNEIVRKKLAGA